MMISVRGLTFDSADDTMVARGRREWPSHGPICGINEACRIMLVDTVKLTISNVGRLVRHNMAWMLGGTDSGTPACGLCRGRTKCGKIKGG